ncbi:MAG: thiamine pyrophosphate-dependent dehydrogenase E1 component subunit alpha [Chloroflexi bacterium]|nr:MAG: thiamine pyrophosphate-dependent dehydrogenase E1 component subunit alpha [Chloroflexota bacterium]TMD48549.1 MAG: thiamine pyrophosphate-dependent dehydrogenase E1 component subunit alpha [Chloroflexota bacterium]
MSTDVVPLTRERVLDAYRTVLRARALDDRRFVLNRAGKLAFIISPRGHEVAQVAAITALEPGRDRFCLYYRNFAAALACGFTPEELMLAAFARAADPSSGGRQTPGNFGSRRRGVVIGSSTVGPQIPKAAGIGLALKWRGEGALCYVSFGEGATSQGDFHEGLNFAAIHRCPVIFFCENNHWAISVPQRLQVAGPGVAERAAAYGIPGIRVRGDDFFAVHMAVQQAARRARAGEGPSLIEAEVLRLQSHSTDDDQRAYRDAAELAAEAERDPIPRMRNALIERGWLNADDDAALRDEVNREVEQATDAAEAAPDPDPASLSRHVYANA